MDLVDLHVHSTASDGSFPPAAVVRLAREGGLRAIALTDHDTIDGIDEALRAGRELGVEVIPGVEISAAFGGESMHILGYFLDYRSGRLDERLAVLKQARASRNPKIIAKLNARGIPITMAQVARLSGGGQVGRPHIARALFDGGFVRTIQEAFDIYLRHGGLAYVAKFRFQPEEALDMIREARGVPVLAHPFTLGVAPGVLENLLKELQAQGLAGIEVFYADHTPDQEAFYLKLSRELGLLITGGSDFHGLNKPEVSLGTFRSQKKLTYERVVALKAWRQKQYGIGSAAEE
jgi:predicted metal-dependent phosphoesterase TrpH